MKLQELKQESFALSEVDRAELVVSVLETLPPVAVVSDAEVERRDEELDRGDITPMLHDEFVRKVQQQRGR